ncbi:hypothetical protein R3P38DRAFT_2780599 [Favolaschia claudopus]|uniref:Uncharacterized protein n=1 Tax=Favolaschia claudopus TaxID=2862362 RepID=A0AAW0B9L0_9AGAR
MQSRLANIETTFNRLAALPSNLNRFNQAFFRQRYSAVQQLAEGLEQTRTGLLKVYADNDAENDALLPDVVVTALDRILYECGTIMEQLDASILPFRLPDDDNDEDVTAFRRMSATYADRPLSFYRNFRPAPTQRFLHVFFYLATAADALLQKWRVDDAAVVDVRSFRLPPGVLIWGDLEVLDVKTGTYAVAGRDLNMVGRGRILIFRRIGLTAPDCPSLERREHAALESAHDPASEDSHESDASSPLPPSSPPNDESDSSEEVVEDTDGAHPNSSRSSHSALAHHDATTAPVRATAHSSNDKFDPAEEAVKEADQGHPNSSNPSQPALAHHDPTPALVRATADFVVRVPEQVSQSSLKRAAESEATQEVVKKQRIDDPPARSPSPQTAPVPLSYEERPAIHGGLGQPAFYVSSSDPDYPASPDVEILD